MKTFLFLVCLHLLCFSLINADFCETGDCRRGDCELVRQPTGLIKKNCHCTKGVCGETCHRLCNTTSACDANPCWFGGICVDVANFDHVCLCPPNHSGKDCRVLLSCQANSCWNGGICIETAYGARCNCSGGYSGEYCQYRTATSTSAPKRNGTLPRVEYKQFDAETLAVIATLGNAANDEPAQRTGDLSENVVVASGNHSQFVFCLTNPCENGGTCFVTNTATTKGICVCRDGYVGDYCEVLFNTTSPTFRFPTGYCSSSPCLNDGSCVEVGELQGYCRCTAEYRGLYCEISVRAVSCNPNPCKNGGTCILLENNQAQCLCTPVFRGLTCNQFSYVPCGDATCHGTQGVCVANKCICKTGFAGPRCDSTDFCSAFPCLNGGTCIRTNEEPYGGCSCPPEFSGPTCSNDPCTPSPCLNGGYCIRKPDNQFYCQCRNKNKGVYCEQVECFPSDATVEVLNNGKVALSSLQVGTQVRVINDQNQISYSPIIAFLHRDVNEHALYKHIRTKTSFIELSRRHLIHRRQDGFVWAEKLAVGDEILVSTSSHTNETQWEVINEINDVFKQGLMAPLTEQGTIIVNNVHASCYALVKSHQVAHFALAPYRLYHRLFGSLLQRHPMTTPILSYANVLLHFFKNLPVAKDLIF
ncbi:unnamed protein product [Adineta ricciae]|uniref:EGF-like domain-containing protein n=1 Tax=Adineta ricciae TaxID=249248 RepID=A0A814LRN0_ADIRI|nr:unnamed protein product [Adineta ricciae]